MVVQYLLALFVDHTLTPQDTLDVHPAYSSTNFQSEQAGNAKQRGVSLHTIQPTTEDITLPFAECDRPLRDRLVLCRRR